MKTALLALVVISIGFAYANAETYEDTVKFDLFNNSTVTGSGGTFIDDGENFYYEYKWFIDTPNSTEFIEELVESFEEIVEEIIEEQEIAKEVFDIETPVIPLTPTERLIEKLTKEKERESISTADKELLRLLEATQKACELGIEHGERIQQYGHFELPDLDPRIDTATDFTTNWQLGNIVKKFEECEAWNKYRFSHLGAQYLNMEVDDSTSQKTHRQMVASLETYPIDRLSEHDFAVAEKQAQEWICEASFYDRQFKTEQGCFDNADWVDYNLPNPLDFNKSYRDYLEYLSTGHVDLNTLKKQEVKKALQQSLQSFAQQHNIPIEDLKNLMQSVDEYNEQKIKGAKQLP